MKKAEWTREQSKETEKTMSLDAVMSETTPELAMEINVKKVLQST